MYHLYITSNICVNFNYITNSGTNNLTIYGFDGRQLNTIRNQEGFMGPKFGHASCLYFHPIKLSIAAGFVDNSVSVYVTASDAKK